MKISLSLPGKAFALVAAGQLFWTGAVHGHDPGLSTATLRLRAGAVDAVLTFALADAQMLVALDSNLDGKVSPTEFAAGRGHLGELIASEFIVRFDGQLVMPAEPSPSLDDKNNVEVQLSYGGRPLTHLTVESKLLALLPPGHRQFLSIQNASGQPLAEQLLSAKADSFALKVSAAPAAGPAHSFLDFLLLGIRHIITGYDHLLFLFALLIVTADFLSALKVVTCFTIAHSITLAVATFNLVAIPSRVVEPLIAASIVYVGVENLVQRGAPKGRWLLTFTFGLVHGFGFASVLRELGVASGTSGIVVPLVSFNLGVEVGQIAVAALVLPVVWKLKRRPSFIPRYVPACSILIALAGGCWLIERVLPSLRF